jgi:hypothetical protein
MHHEPLFQPLLSRLPVPSAYPEYFRFEQMSFPEAERAGEVESIWLDENVFRAGHDGVNDMTNALLKVQANAAHLVKVV